MTALPEATGLDGPQGRAGPDELEGLRVERPPEVTSGPAQQPLLAWAATTIPAHPAGGADLVGERDALVDLTDAPVDAVAGLLAGRSQAASTLVRDPHLRHGWLGRLRRFRLRVAELDDHGWEAGCLVAGTAQVGDREVPVLLRRCRVSVSGPADAVLEPHGDWLINPALAQLVPGWQAGQVAPEDVASERVPPEGGQDLGALVHGPARALARHGVQTAQRLVLAPVVAGDPVLRSLLAVAARATAPGTAPPGTTAHPRTAAASGPAPHLLDTVPVPPGAAVVTVPQDPGPGEDEVRPAPREDVIAAAIDDLVAAALDDDQLDVVRLVLRGRHVVVDAPPATGATTVAATLAVLAVATGRRCLILTPTRTQGDLVADRVSRLGPASSVVRGRVPATHRAPLVPQLEGVPDGGDEARRLRLDASARFARARAALLARDPQWQVSRLEALDALAALDAGPPGPVLVRWAGVPAVAHPVMAEVVDAVAEAVMLGEHDLAAVDSPWRQATVADAQGEARAVALAREVSGAMGRAATAAAASLSEATSVPVPVTVAELTRFAQLFAGVRATLDVLLPEVFDAAMPDLIAATAPSGYRDRLGLDMSPLRRRRLVSRARSLLKPGADPGQTALHAALVAAAAQRGEWQSAGGRAGWPFLPAEGATAVAAMTALLDAVRELGAVHPGFAPHRRVDDVVTLARRIVAAADGSGRSPRRSALRQVWSDAGASPVVERLLGDLVALAGPDRDEATAQRLRRHDLSVAARDALWRGWWSAAAAATRPDPDDPAATTRALRDHVDADVVHRRAAAARAAAAVAALPHPLPARVAVPVEVTLPAPVPADPSRGAAGADALVLAERPDVLVVDDAGAVPFVEAAAALAVSRQVVVLGDVARAATGSVLEVLRGASGIARVSLRRRHRPLPVPLAAGGGPSGPVELALAVPADAVRVHHVADATGLPGPGEEVAETSDAEVMAVVDLVVEVATGTPAASVGVVALTRTHAAAVAGALRARVRARPDLSAAFGPDRPEPVVVMSADQARGLERDVVVVTTGFPRTPHGRVLHRFGPLDDDAGEALLATALTRARRTVHVVSGLRSFDLDPSRLHGRGARALSALLAGAELLGGPGDDSVVVAPVPVDTVFRDVEPGGEVGRLVAADLEEIGLSVTPGPEGAGLTVSGPDGARVVVDLDVAFADTRAAELRSRRLSDGGWSHVVLAAEEVAARRTTTISDLARPLVDPPHPARNGPRPGGPATPSPAAATPAAGDPEARSPAAAGIADRAPEDSDVGWGGAPARPDDDRILSERPPHW